MPDNNELQLNFSNKVDVLQNKSNTTSVFLVISVIQPHLLNNKTRQAIKMIKTCIVIIDITNRRNTIDPTETANMSWKVCHHSLRYV